MRILDRIRSAVSPAPSVADGAHRLDPSAPEAAEPAHARTDARATSREEAPPVTAAGSERGGDPALEPDAALEPDDVPEPDPTLEPDPAGPRIRLTPAALDKVREMLRDEDLLEDGGLRLTARHGAGCSAPLQFGMVMEVEAQPEDEVLEGNGIRLFIDRKSSWSLDGLMIDYVDSPTMGAGFAFRHPRGMGGRSC